MSVFIPGESDWPHPACLAEAVLLRETNWLRSKSSGPGGQNRNKVETGVEMVHLPTNIVGRASERRTVAENRRIAIKRLRLNLATEHRIGVPLGEIGSRLWFSRRQAPARGPGQMRPRWGSFAHRIVVNPSHWDYPALLAEAMDVINASNYDMKRAALRLEVSTTQLLRLIAEHQPALTKLNAERQAMGLGRLRMNQ